ncbi:MAG: CRISPR-associated protein Cas4 [Magnetococcus sp. XQGC-1]
MGFYAGSTGSGTACGLIGMEPGDEALSLSALNQYGYCPRRFGLIYLEGEFAENVHTRRGDAAHARVDAVAERAGPHAGRVETALPVWSERLGLTGRCDVVEFSDEGVPYPVEYKHGSRRKWLNDDLQVAAQAICLEEMTGHAVPLAAIYHISSRRRREVAITPLLRREVERVVGEMRALLVSRILPPPHDDARCRECSLLSLCQPELLLACAQSHRLRTELYQVES